MAGGVTWTLLVRLFCSLSDESWLSMADIEIRQVGALYHRSRKAKAAFRPEHLSKGRGNDHEQTLTPQTPLAERAQASAEFHVK